MTRQRGTKRLGLDFGRVIVSPLLDGVDDTAFLGSTLETAMQTPPAPDSFESIRALVDSFGEDVWIVSKAGPSVQRKTQAWLDHWGFYQATGVRAGHIRFCLERSDKATHCEELGITHFVDDRMEVLEHLRGLVPKLYLFGEQPGLATAPEWLIATATWRDVVDEILG